MYLAFLYLGVLFVWATTPFAIYLSSQDIGPFLSVALRMTIAVPIIWLILLLRRQPLQLKVKHWKVYAAAGLGICPNMPMVYWASQYIPTGMMSLILSASPFFVGLFSRVLLQESLGVKRVVGMIIAFVGLAIIFGEQVQLGGDTLIGFLVMCVSTVIFAASAVLVKKLGSGVGPMQQGAGAMLYAAPGLWIIWWCQSGQWPSEAAVIPISALVYLITIGSVFAFSAYFFLLERIKPSTLSLTTMISPVIAIGIGAVFNGETISSNFVVGATFLLAGLAVYMGVVNAFRRKRRQTMAAPSTM
jgi:drug/metabolite transporter (DMT)-like permease